MFIVYTQTGDPPDRRQPLGNPEIKIIIFWCCVLIIRHATVNCILFTRTRGLIKIIIIMSLKCVLFMSIIAFLCQRKLFTMYVLTYPNIYPHPVFFWLNRDQL